MRVLHINQSDIHGGAAIAGYRLHQGLLTQGIDSRLLVGRVDTRSELVAGIPIIHPMVNRFRFNTGRFGFNYINILSSFNIPKHSFFKNADVLNFHNLHTGYFNYLAIPSLTQQKPAIWTLHDMWSLTGHCAYSFECERWKIGCGKCPYPDTYPPIGIDNSHLEWKLKNWVYSNSNLTIVTDSSWLAQQAKQSMLNRFSIYHIPYGLDTEAYQPLDPEQCKSALGIPSEKKVLMFGAFDVKDPRKGGDLLLKALEDLPASLKANIVILVLGYAGDAYIQSIGLSCVNLGYLTNDRLKCIAFSAADLFLFPTRADAFGIVAQEAAACGTPTVAFKVGGVSDIVRPGLTGYLAQPEDCKDFGQGIINLLEDKNQRMTMAKTCREIVVTEYPLELQAKRYIELYQKVLENR
jgi:glycosyltransferase involved in cell wall biosynthesis